LSLSGCKQPNGTKIIIPSAGPASANFFSIWSTGSKYENLAADGRQWTLKG
jgi:hypothetical protein